ncbi:hypothetical protein J4426_03575 [Candidatus Woesearchaeota archaeon]|nr:hypothetical protein [Candidatus Woesearchaeota archaeon]
MKELIRTTKKWGNSVGILLGKDFKPNTKVRVLISEEKKVTKAGDVFGILKMKTSTEKLMKEIDKELWG